MFIYVLISTNINHVGLSAEKAMVILKMSKSRTNRSECNILTQFKSRKMTLKL